MSDEDAKSALARLKGQLERAYPSTADEEEIHVVPVKIMPKADGGRMYSLGTGSFSVYPEPDAVVTVHRACQEEFDHERLEDGTLLGYAAVTGRGDLLHYDLLDADDVEHE